MNLLSRVSKESDALKISGLTSLVYFLLISNASSEDETLWSEYIFDDVLEKLKDFSEEAINESLDELVSKELIVEETIDEVTYFDVGTDIDKIKKLYVGIPVSIKDDFKGLIKLSEGFKHIAKSGRLASLAKRTNIEIVNLSDVTPNKYDMKTFMKLFSLCYECTHQEAYREFQKKEFGQMKNFIKVFDSATAIKIIIKFSLNFDVWCKSMSIGNLLFFKDDIYTSMKGDFKKEKMRSDVEDESF